MSINIGKYHGDFIVTKDMVINGKIIKDKIPNIIVGDFTCTNHTFGLTSLEGSPEIVEGNFYCCNLGTLKTLEGGPSKVYGDYKCDNNKLTNLIGSPDIFNSKFICGMNTLISLEGAPVKCLHLSYSSYYIRHLDIESEFILSKYYKNKYTYWIDLLSYVIKEKIDLKKVPNWPVGFLNDNTLKSVKILNKFNL